MLANVYYVFIFVYLDCWFCLRVEKRCSRMGVILKSNNYTVRSTIVTPDLIRYYKKTNTCPPPQIQVKYIPRSLYDEQLSDDPSSLVSNQFKSMFEDTDPLITLRRG